MSAKLLGIQIAFDKDYNPAWGVPVYANPGDAGFDLRAAIERPVTIQAEERHIISTGLRFSIPEGFEMQIRPRSGLAAKHGLTMINAPGTIDSGFRGTVQAILYRLKIAGDTSHLTINPGDRIGQGVIAPVIQARFNLVDTLDATQRGAAGFGSTGRS